MKLILVPFLVLLSGCAVGANGFSTLVSELAIDSNPEDGMTESGCFFGEYVGTWTKSRITYTKIVHPDGTPPPEC